LPSQHDERSNQPVAATNKCLAKSNKSCTEDEATKECEAANHLDQLSPMKPTIKIRFTEPQIALVMHAHPNCNLGHLTELSFEFDGTGKIVDCIGTIKNGGNADHDYAGSGLARLYERARRKFTGRSTSAMILQFPNGGRPAS
jgi:hypothetical protein